MSRFKKSTTLVILAFILVFVLSAGLAACDNKTKYVNVTFDFDGGELGGETGYNVNMTAGQEIDLSLYIPTKKGYVFAGWSDGKDTYSGIITPTESLSLKALWLESSAVTTLNALKAIIAGFQKEGALSFAFEGSGKDADGNVTGIALKANVTSEEKYTLAIEFSDGNGNKAVGVYVMDGVFYVWSPDMGGVALEDFDMNYILQVADRVPEVLGNLLGGLDIVGMDMDTILGMLFTMFTTTSAQIEGNNTVYRIEINPKGLQGIVSLLNLINLDSILQGAGLNIKTSGFIDWFKGILPDMKINLNVALDNTTGKLSSVTSDAQYEGAQYFEFSTTRAGFYKEGEVETVAPSELVGYQQISLGNIDLGVDLSVNNTNADLGALLNAITGKQAFAEGALVLSSGLDYRLNLRTSLDIAQKGEGDENYIVLELYEKKEDGTLVPFIGAYYKEGNLYVDIAKTLGGIYGGKGVKIGVDLKELISQVKNVVTDAIDSVFFTEGRALNGNAKLDKNGVVALSGSEGNYYVSGGALNFIKVLVGVFGVDGSKVSVTDGTDEDGKYSILNFKVDDEFLSAFLNAIGQTSVKVPEFGAINLGIKLNADGLAQIDADANLAGGIKASLCFDSFSIGKSPEFEGYEDISDYVDAQVGDESKYTYSVKELVGSVLSGIYLDTGINLTLSQGKYNIMDLVSLFGVENAGGVVTPWTVTADSAVKARLTVKAALDAATNKINASVVITLEEDFNLGADKILPAGKLIAVYLSEDGTGYADLSGISLFGVNLPAFKAEIDLSSVIDNLMKTLDIQLKFDVSGLFGTGEEQTLSRLNADGSATPLSMNSEITAEASEIIINSDSFRAKLTLAAVASVLNAFGVQFALPEGLNVVLDASLDGNGLNIGANASVAASEGYDALGLGLGITVGKDGFKTGVSGLSDEIEQEIKAETANLADAQSNVIKALLGTVGKMSLSAEIEVDSKDQAALSEFVEQFVEKWLPDTDIDVEITGGKVGLLVALNAERGEYAVVLTEGDGNVLLSARACGETIVVTVMDFGSFLLRDTGIIKIIEDAVNKAVDGIENADLNTLFENLLNPADTPEETPDGTTDETPAEPGTGDGGEQSGTAIDIISLLGGISACDALINIDITREMIATILSSLGIDVDFVSVSGAIDVTEGKVDVIADIGGALSLGIGLAIGRTDDESIDYGFALDLLRAYGDDGFVPDGQNDIEDLRAYLVKGLSAYGEYFGYMEGWSLSALTSEYTRYVDAEGVLVFTSEEDLQQYVTGLLEGISLKADVTLDFTPGEYNILGLVGKFVDLTTLGLPSDASLVVSFGQPTIDLSIRFNSAIRQSGGIVDGVMALEIVANQPLSLGTTVGGGEGITVIPAGEALLAVYIKDGSLYIDATALEVLGLNLPVFKVDNFDLPSFLYNTVESAISGLFADGEQSGNGSQAQALALAGGDGGNISLIIARNKLQLSATMSAIGALLANFLTGDSAATADKILSALGGINAEISLVRDDSQGKGVYTFSLDVEGNVMQTVSGEPSDFALSLKASTADIVAGDKTLYETLNDYVGGRISGYDKTYSDILKGIADNLFTGSMLIDLNVDFNAGKYYLNELVNNIISVATGGNGISVPIAVETGDFNKQLQLALQWNLNSVTKTLTMMFEVRNAGNILVGVYLYGGELVADLSGVGLFSVKVSNVGLIEQLSETLTGAIDSLQGLDLNEILGNLFGNSSGAEEKAVVLDATEGETDGETEGDSGASGGENAWIAQLLGVVMLENTNIKLALSTQLLQEIIFALTGKQIDLGSDLFDLSANLGILSGTVAFDATLFGEKEDALISMSVNAALSNGMIVSDAYIPAIFLYDHYEIDATDTGTVIRDVIDNLADINFKLNLSVSFKKGTYNVAELLAKFGVSALEGTQLLWTFNEDTDIELALKVSLKAYSDDGTAGGRNGMASIEIVAEKDLNLGASNLVKAGSVLIGLYAYDDTLYIDASGIKLLGITFPVFKVDFDLLGAVVAKLNQLGNTAEEQSQPVAVVTSETGESTVMTPLDDEHGEIVVGISENEIAVTAALGAIIAVLGDMGVDLGIDLSAFDLNAGIRLGNGLSISVGGVLLPTTDGERNALDLTIEIPSDALEFGIDVAALDSYLRSKAENYKDYNDDLIATLKQTLGNNSIKANLTVDAESSEVDINSLISGLLQKLGVNLNIPVQIEFDELYYDLEVLLNWNIETRQLMLEIVMHGTVNNKTVLGIYGDWEDLYIALGGLGLVDIHVAGSPLVPVLFNLLDETLAGINPIIISDILNDLFYGKDIAAEAENAAESAAMFAEGGETGTLAVGSNDIIRYLLSAIKITDSKVVADITSDVMSQIFRALGFDIDFVLEAGLGIDLAGEQIEAYINMGSDATIALTLGFNGKPDRYKPEDTSKFVTLDTTSEEVDGGQVVKQFLDGFELALALDLKTNTVGTVVDSSEPDNQYTRLELNKINGPVTLDNCGATVGAIGHSAMLLSVYDIDESEYYTHGTGSKKAMLHFYLDYANGKATIYLGNGYFTVVGGLIGLIQIDIASYLSSGISLDLDILGMLAPTVENLIKQVYDAANNLGQEETPSEPSAPSQDTGTEEEATGIAKVFADLNLEALLRPGITINLLSTGVGNINVKLDPYELNKMIDGVMNCIFGADTIIDMTTLQLGNIRFNKNYLAYMWWDRVAASNTVSAVSPDTTPYSVWDSIIRQLPHIVDDALSGINGALSAVSGVVKYDRTAQNLHRIVKRLLPFAVYNEAEINVNFIEGTLANVSFTGTDTGAKVEQYILDENTGEWQNTGKVLTQTVRTLFNVVDSGPDNLNVYSYSYEYGSYNDCYYGGKGRMWRSGFSYYSTEGFRTNNYRFGNEIQIYNKSGAVGDSSYTLSGTEGVVDWGNLSQNITFNPYMYSSNNGYQAAVDEYWTRYFSDYGTAVYQKGTSVKRGSISLTYNGNAFTKDVLKSIMNSAGTHTIKATANYSDGTASSMNITFKVKNVASGGADCVRTVDPINLHVYESLPDYITVTTYSGEKVKYFTDGVSVTLTGAGADSVKGGSKTAYLTFANGSRYPVTVNYYDSTVFDQTVNISWYDLDFKDGGTDAGKESIIDQLIGRFNLYYADGTFIPELLTEGITWDMSALDALISRPRTDLSAATVDVTFTIDKKIAADGVTLEPVENALKQTVTLRLSLDAKSRNALVYEGQKESGVLSIDPYMYYLYLSTGDEKYNPFPSKATATYTDGKTETIDVKTIVSGNPDWGYNSGSVFDATVRTDESKYEGAGWFYEDGDVTVTVNRNVIKAVYFDDAMTQNYVVAGETYTSATVVFENGLQLKMPVAVTQLQDKAFVYIGFDLAIYEEYGKIAAFEGLNGTFLQAYAVEIR